MTGVQEIEHSVGEHDEAAGAANPSHQGRSLFHGREGWGPACAHSPDIRMPPENDQRWGGRKTPTSFSRDVTRNE